MGIVFGFLGSLIAISTAPLLVGGSLAPAINAWKNPLYLAAVAILCLGWVYGALAELTIYLIHRGRYRHIGILMLACVVIRLVGMLPLARVLQH